MPLRVCAILLAAFVAVLPSLEAKSKTTRSGSEITGRVVGVHDGDTITVLTADKQSVKVRLFGIDAPESKQPFGSRAKQELSALVFGKDVRVVVANRDRYGRTIGRVFVGQIDVSLAMVRAGMAWWYSDYAKKARDLQAAESDARQAKRGVWSEPEPVAPWLFRRNARARQA